MPNASQSRYRTNHMDLWMKRYNSMRQRVNDTSGNHSHSTIGKELCGLYEFLDWCKATKDRYLELWEQWKDNEFATAYAPSIDRIDEEGGYTIGNLQWLTTSENVRKAKEYKASLKQK